MATDDGPQRISFNNDREIDEERQSPASERDYIPAIGVDRKIPASMWWIYFVLGAAILLPWNAMITATPYFLNRLTGSSLQSAFSSYLSTTFTVTGFCFLGYATINTKNQKHSSTIRRSLWILTLLNLLLTLSTFTIFPPFPFFSFVILNGVFQSATGAFLQSSVVAVASLFGPIALQSVMSGQAAIGVLISVIQVISGIAGVKSNSIQSSEEEDEASVRAAFLFFGISTLFLLLALIFHAWLITIPTYKATVIPFEATKGVVSNDEERESLVTRDTTTDRPRKGIEKNQILNVAKLNIIYNIAVAYVFVVTLAVFPVITSSIRSVHFPPTTLFTQPLLFMALHFVTYNIGDLIGRYLPLLRPLQIWSSRSLLIMSLARTLFVPAFLACNVVPPGSPSSAPEGVIVNSDILFFVILLLFGITNGYIGSLVMMAAPSPQHNPRLRGRPEDVDVAATVAQFSLVGGLAVGGFSSFAVRGLLCGCNPFVQ